MLIDLGGIIDLVIGKNILTEKEAIINFFE